MLSRCSFFSTAASKLLERGPFEIGAEVYCGDHIVKVVLLSLDTQVIEDRVIHARNIRELVREVTLRCPVIDGFAVYLNTNGKVFREVRNLPVTNPESVTVLFQRVVSKAVGE